MYCRLFLFLFIALGLFFGLFFGLNYPGNIQVLVLCILTQHLLNQKSSNMAGLWLTAQCSVQKLRLVTAARRHATGAQVCHLDLHNVARSSLNLIVGTVQVHVPQIPALVCWGLVVYVTEGMRTFPIDCTWGTFSINLTPNRYYCCSICCSTCTSCSTS